MRCTVSPDLPVGLTLDPHTGVIGGTPAAVVPLATYTVTCSNSAGTVCQRRIDTCGGLHSKRAVLEISDDFCSK